MSKISIYFGWFFTLAGNGNYQILNQYLRNIKNKKKIIIHNKISYDKIHKIYNKTDIFIFASSCENFPNILLEAISSGLPICCANKEPMKSIGGKNLFYFNEKNPKSLENKINYILKNRNKLRIKNYHSILKKYSWKKTAENTFSQLEYLSQ